MLRLIRKIPKTEVPRVVRLYFSAEDVVVAPVYRNLDGIYFEQPNAAKRLTAPTSEEIGLAFQKAFESFAVQDKNLRDFKKSEWPAYLVSATKSLKEFEKLYRPVNCQSENSSNVIVRANTPHAAVADIEFTTSFNPWLRPDAVGSQLLSLVAAANAT